MTNSGKNDPKSVLITGCYSGFGRQMVTAFLEDGWIVYATMRRVDERRETFAKESLRFEEKIQLMECDVTSANDRQAVAKAIEKSGRGLDCLVNNAGFMLLGALEGTGEAQLRSQMETNFFAVALLTQELLPALRYAQGTIINVSSIYGFFTWPLTSVYCASKYALEGMSQSLKQELLPYGVKVALLEPSSHATGLMDHLCWGDRQVTNETVYREESSAYAAFRRKLAKRKEAPSTDVARAAVQIARSRSPKLHNPVGTGSTFMYLAVRLLPELIGWRLMDWAARRSFRKAAQDSSGGNKS